MEEVSAGLEAIMLQAMLTLQVEQKAEATTFQELFHIIEDTTDGAIKFTTTY